MLDLAGLADLFEPLEHILSIVDVGRWAVKLHEIEAVDVQVLQRAVDEGLDIGLGITVSHMRVQTTTGLGRHHRPLAAACLQHLGDDLLRPAVAIDVSRIDEGHAGIESRVECCPAVGLGNFAPGSADLPCAEADIADGEFRPAKFMFSHRDVSPVIVASS